VVLAVAVLVGKMQLQAELLELPILAVEAGAALLTILVLRAVTAALVLSLLKCPTM
jgi:hypothetical protein